MPSLPNISLVLGGARSGKSRFAEKLVTGSGLKKTYIATAEAGDAEMQVRIAAHQMDRGPSWTTVEAPIALCPQLRELASPDSALLVDCLTLWLSNLMLSGHDIDLEIGELAGCLANLAGPVVFVSNEVGLGIVPDNDLGRCFRDHQGRLNQKIAELADYVVLLVAGLPMTLKTLGHDA